VVETSYMNTDMCKFELPQSEESRGQLIDSSKACSTGPALSRCNWCSCTDAL